MQLSAREYPDMWEFSNERPCPPSNYSKSDKVDIFIQTFLKDNYIGRVVIFNKKILSQIFRGKEYRSVVLVEKRDILRLQNTFPNICRRNFLSAVFVPTRPSQFLQELLMYGHYGNPASISIGDGSDSDPLNNGERECRLSSISELFNKGETLFSFSHDADFLYEIFR